jgi:RecQ mediated genome instability protein
MLPVRQQVASALKALNIAVRPEWLSQCMTVLNLSGKPQKAAVSAVYIQYLACDLREAGAGCLPQGIATLHLQTVPGSLVLQLDAWLNIGEVSLSWLCQ